MPVRQYICDHPIVKVCYITQRFATIYILTFHYITSTCPPIDSCKRHFKMINPNGELEFDRVSTAAATRGRFVSKDVTIQAVLPSLCSPHKGEWCLRYITCPSVRLLCPTMCVYPVFTACVEQSSRATRQISKTKWLSATQTALAPWMPLARPQPISRHGLTCRREADTVLCHSLPPFVLYTVVSSRHSQHTPVTPRAN